MCDFSIENVTTKKIDITENGNYKFFYGFNTLLFFFKDEF